MFERVQEGSRGFKRCPRDVREGLREVRDMFGRVGAIRNVPGTLLYTYFFGHFCETY